jgi:hypothetical protein
MDDLGASKFEPASMKELDALLSSPSYTWPASAAGVVERALDSADPDTLMRSLGIAGDLSVMNQRIATRLLAIIASSRSVAERVAAVLAFSPALEQAFEVGLDHSFDGSFDEPALTPALFDQIRATLGTLYHDLAQPDELRRACLESSIHAGDSWHWEAVSQAFGRSEPEWQATAIHCMGRLHGFEEELVGALASPDQRLQCEAVRSVARRQLEAAGPIVLELASRTSVGAPVRHAAIEALGWLCPPGSGELLRRLAGSDDPTLAELANQALRERRAFSNPPSTAT